MRTALGDGPKVANARTAFCLFSALRSFEVVRSSSQAVFCGGSLGLGLTESAAFSLAGGSCAARAGCEGAAWARLTVLAVNARIADKSQSYTARCRMGITCNGWRLCCPAQS